MDKDRQHIVIGVILVASLGWEPAKFFCGEPTILLVIRLLLAGSSEQLLTATGRWGLAGDT